MNRVLMIAGLILFAALFVPAHAHDIGGVDRQSPEPGIFILAGAGLIGLSWAMKRRRQRS